MCVTSSLRCVCVYVCVCVYRTLVHRRSDHAPGRTAVIDVNHFPRREVTQTELPDLPLAMQLSNVVESAVDLGVDVSSVQVVQVKGIDAQTLERLVALVQHRFSGKAFEPRVFLVGLGRDRQRCLQARVASEDPANSFLRPTPLVHDGRVNQCAPDTPGPRLDNSNFDKLLELRLGDLGWCLPVPCMVESHGAKHQTRKAGCGGDFVPKLAPDRRRCRVGYIPRGRHGGSARPLGIWLNRC